MEISEAGMSGDDGSFGHAGIKPHISEIETLSPQYEQLLADVWVGIVLTLLLLSCMCCMCSCLLYHKFQQWKRAVLRNAEDPTDLGSINGINIDCESLPSYTMASGLPTYEEALQQMEKKTEKFDKQDVALHMGGIQSVNKSSLFNYLHEIVQKKT